MMALRREVRWAIGGVLSAAVVAGVVSVIPASVPGIERETLSVTARPEPATAVLACSGALLASGRDQAAVAALEAAAGQRLVSGTTAGSPDSTTADGRAADVPDAPAVVSFSAEPVDRVRTDLAAAGSARVSAPDIAGFAASACTPPVMESWLVGGSGLTGAADLVLISNPGDVAARVDLTVFGATGRISSDAGAGVLVPAGSQRVVPLASLALGEQSPVVLVSATQAPVHATLQSSLTRTLVPVGVDQGGATPLPAARQTIPAFPAVGGADASAGATVRLLAPSDAGTAAVRVLAVGTDEVVASFDDLELTAAVPLELDLESLAAGRYRVEVEATAPVVAAVHASTGAQAGADFGWFGAADAVEVPSLFAVAEGPSPRLTLVNPGSEDVRALLAADAGGGGERAVVVPAGGSASVDVRAGELYRLDPGDGALRANVTFAASDALAGYAVVPADAAAAPVEVRPR